MKNPGRKWPWVAIGAAAVFSGVGLATRDRHPRDCDRCDGDGWVERDPGYPFEPVVSACWCSITPTDACSACT